MRLTPQDLLEQVKGNNVIRSMERMTDVIENVAPIAPPPRPRRQSKAERRRLVALSTKRNKRPLFDAALCFPPAGVIAARQEYSRVASTFKSKLPLTNLREHADRLPEIEPSFLDAVAETVQPPSSSGSVTASPDTTDVKAAMLLDKVKKTRAKRDADTRLAAVRKFRKRVSRTLADSRVAFDAALEGARSTTFDCQFSP